MVCRDSEEPDCRGGMVPGAVHPFTYPGTLAVIYPGGKTGMPCPDERSEDGGVLFANLSASVALAKEARHKFIALRRALPTVAERRWDRGISFKWTSIYPGIRNWQTTSGAVLSRRSAAESGVAV